LGLLWRRFLWVKIAKNIKRKKGSGPQGLTQARKGNLGDRITGLETIGRGKVKNH
jgi:hypothetical protein